jgi:tetratricopeptide (TPR) repeat protein
MNIKKILSVLCLLITTAFTNHVFAQTDNVYQDKGDVESAGKHYQTYFDNYTKAIKKSGHNKLYLSVLYSKRGDVLNDMGKTNQAITDYNTAITLDADNSDAYWSRGVVYDNEGKYQLAINDYEKSIALINEKKVVGDLSLLYSNVANCELSLKNYPEALIADSLSLSINNHYAWAYSTRGLIHYTMKNYELAIADYTLALVNSTNRDTIEISNILSARADNNRYLKKYNDAINDYSLAIKVYNKNGFAYWHRAAAYSDNGDFKLGADDYTTAMQYFFTDSTQLAYLYKDRAIDEMNLELLSPAIKDDSVAMLLNPKDRSAYLTMADAHMRGGDYQLSIDYYNKAMPFYSDEKNAQAVIHNLIATDEYFLKEYDKAIIDCSAAIVLDSTNFQSYFCLGKIYLKKLNKKDLATVNFNKVLQLDTGKKSIEYVFSLLFTGKADEAISIIQASLLTAPDNDALNGDYYNLACLYSIINHADEANIYLKKAFDNGYSKKYAMADEDLNNIRNTDDYKSIIAAASN